MSQIIKKPEVVDKIYRKYSRLPMLSRKSVLVEEILNLLIDDEFSVEDKTHYFAHVLPFIAEHKRVIELGILIDEFSRADEDYTSNYGFNHEDRNFIDALDIDYIEREKLSQYYRMIQKKIGDEVLKNAEGVDYKFFYNLLLDLLQEQSLPIKLKAVVLGEMFQNAIREEG